MKRAARFVAWAMVSMALPAYYSACVIFVLNVVGAIRVEWQVILGLLAYPLAAIAVDVLVKAWTSPNTITEPGGSPGTEG